tara:strand:+ start:273 stop:632 length:360 start_codon:yes stop_codon:yes gene_type:complete
MKTGVQLIEKEVPSAGAVVTISEDLDNNYRYVDGIAMMDNIGLNHILKQSSIDGKELYPKGFEVSFFQSNLFVAPDNRFLSFEKREANGNKIELEVEDGGTAPSYPYTLKIYLRLSNAE